jgi:PDZ domain
VRNGPDDPSPSWWWDEDSWADDRGEPPWGGPTHRYYGERGISHLLRRPGKRALAVAAGVAGLLAISVAGVFGYRAVNAFVQPKAASIAAQARPPSGGTAGSVPAAGSGSAGAGSLGAGPTPGGSASEPLDSAAVAARVDPGLVDIDTVIDYGQAVGAGTPSFAGGTVTATGQAITASDELTGSQEQLTGVIETDADIRAGDSGGPLANGSGQVIGMDTASSQSFQLASGAQSAGFAIPISTATAIVSEILSGGSSDSVHVGPTAYLGVLAASGNGGLLIGQVFPGLPAADAGLVQGDVITSVGGYTVATQPELEQLMLTAFWPGEVVTVQYTDDAGQQQSVTLALASGPPF